MQQAQKVDVSYRDAFIECMIMYKCHYRDAFICYMIINKFQCYKASIIDFADILAQESKRNRQSDESLTAVMLRVLKSATHDAVSTFANAVVARVALRP